MLVELTICFFSNIL